MSDDTQVKWSLIDCKVKINKLPIFFFFFLVYMFSTNAVSAFINGNFQICIFFASINPNIGAFAIGKVFIECNQAGSVELLQSESV